MVTNDFNTSVRCGGCGATMKIKDWDKHSKTCVHVRTYSSILRTPTKTIIGVKNER